MVLAKRFSEVVIDDVRRRYNDTHETMLSISARLGIDRSTLYRNMKKWGGFIARQNCPPLTDLPEPPPADADAGVAEHAESIEAHFETQRDAMRALSLVERLERAVELDLLAVERVIARLHTGRSHFIEAERAARTLVSLTRILKEIAALRGAENAESAPRADEGTDDIPTDIDELRRVLAARLDRLAGEMGNGSAYPSDEPA